MSTVGGSALEELALKLGRSVENLWPIAVRYVAVDAVVGMVFCALAFAVTSFAAKKLWAMSEVHGRDADLPKFGIIVVAFFVFALCGVHFFGNLSALLNPEGHLVMKVLGQR